MQSAARELGRRERGRGASPCAVGHASRRDLSGDFTPRVAGQAVIPKQMRAAYIERYGGDEVVQIGLRPVPEPGPTQVLIEVHAAAVNPRDFLLRSGRYVFRHFVGGFPKILGSDVSGRVVALGSKVTRVRTGD